jgi:hypothetical protein
MTWFRVTIRHGRPQRYHVVDIRATDLRDAVRQNASDIHLEPRGGGAVVLLGNHAEHGHAKSQDALGVWRVKLGPDVAGEFGDDPVEDVWRIGFHAPRPMERRRISSWKLMSQ